MPARFGPPKPLQFGGGISNLWRGHKRLDSANNLPMAPGLFFNSARSAIAFILKNLPSSYGNDVIVTGFTCSAVTDSVMAVKKNILTIDINQDLTLPFEQIERYINLGARILLLQNTFGIPGLTENQISYLRQKGIFVIIDNSLSYGTKIGSRDIGTFGDVEVQSFEVSKTITCGWGGRLIFHLAEARVKNNCLSAYENIENQKTISALLERYQLSLSTSFINHYRKYGFLVWYILYGLKIFRKSNIKLKKFHKNIYKINKYNNIELQKLLLCNEEIYETVAKNYMTLQKFCTDLNMRCIDLSNSHEGMRIVSPRFSIILRKPIDEFVYQLFDKYKIDYGRWFDELPLKTIDSHKLVNTKYLNAHIINLPIHFTIRGSDLEAIKCFIKDLRDNDY